MSRLASLPMYDLPVVRAATNAWWDGLARHLRAAGLADVPLRLTRGDNAMAGWLSPELLLSQTCGYPLTHALQGAVRLVATPRYHAPGCAGARYSSVLLVAEHCAAQSLGALAGKVAVINSRDSQSGCHVLRYMVAMLADRRVPFFREIKISGSHVASIDMIAAGRADVAAVDAVTHALLARHAPAVLAGTRTMDTSPRTPGLPYITRGDAPDSDIERLRAGLDAAASDGRLAAARQALLLDGFEALSRRAYDSITDMENRVAATGLST